MRINKYQTLEKIFEGQDSIIYRAFQVETRDKVILKFAKSDSSLLRLKNEYEILSSLKVDENSQILNFFPHSEEPFLVVSDIAGLPLSNYIDKIKNYSLERIYQIFLNLAIALNKIHERNIIHKDIKPSNILYIEENDSISIIDFGISSQFDIKLREQKNVNNLEGTLKYISPEQTGRINRSIDQRSDLYSLGITFYQLLTGNLPFTSEDPLELIYFHISRNPERIYHINKTLNDIVFKLIAKNPEDRYQSTYGLIYDLKKLKSGEKDFPIASKDFSHRLQINENLYGRKKEKEILKSLLDKTNQSPTTANYLVIKGEAGQGKSILIEEILKNTILSKGYFLRGKHDIVQENIPYSSISQILKKYSEFLLAEKKETQIRIKNKLLETLGDNTGIVTLLAPEMELILGKQPIPFSLEGTEAQNRFNTILINLLRVMANTTSPLVIVFDDIQWSDTASIQLIKTIISEISIPGLFLILSFRHREENSPKHFLSFLEYIDSKNYITQLELSNLGMEDVQNFLKDAIGENAIQFGALLEFIFLTTHGNPFFTKELLKELYSNKALYFDFSSEKWVFNSLVIQKISMGDNILDFMRIKISSLSSKTTDFLKVAACEGFIFNKLSVNSIINLSEDEFNFSVKEASIAGIIYPLESTFEDNRYSFLHDRILQSAYQLNTSEEVKHFYFKFGNFYKENFPETKIFDICNFYNKSSELLQNEKDRVDLIQFNYKAMLLSRANIAYANGLNFSKMAISYLDKVKSISEEFVFSIKEEYGWFLFATGNFEEGELVYLELLNECKNLKDYARLNYVRIGSLASRARIFDSVNLGLEVLVKLGVTIPKSEEERGSLFFSEFGKILEYMQTHNVDDLLKLKPMQDDIQIIVQQILSRLLIPTILSAQITLLGLLTCISITRVIQFGSIDLVAYAYALFAVTIISIKQDYQSGIEFGEIAIKTSQLYNNKALMGGVFNTVGCITNHLKYPAVDNERLFLNSSKYCEESGNIFENVLSQGNMLWNKFYRGENLNEILIYCNNYQAVCKKYFVWDAMINIYYPTMGIVNYLLGNQTEKNLLYYDGRTELEHVEIVEKLGSKSPLAPFYGILITKSFIFGKYSEILKTGELLEKNTAAPTVFHDICPNFYRCVAYILLFNSLTQEEKNIYNEKINKLKNDFATFSKLNPTNFLHMYLLILAVENFQNNNQWEAMKYFDESITSALENGYIQNAAIAYEIAGNFYRQNAFLKIAETYFFEAYKLFKVWGASLKVKTMEKEFPSFQFSKNTNLNLTNSPTLSNSKSATDFQMDYISTIKAADIILSEVRVDSLIEKIIQVILENSGASEACLLIKKNDKFIVHSYGEVKGKVLTKFINLPLEEFQNISHNITNYVINSKKTIILEKAYTNLDYINNFYLVNKKVQSLLCKPIFHKGNTIGAIYLENNFIAGIFSKERTDIINLISTIAGISLENASLYEELDEKVRKRTNELFVANSKLTEMNSLLENTLTDLKTTQDQLIISEKMVMLGKLIAGIAHEINTPLGAIVASNQVVMDLVSENSLGLLESYSKFDEKEKEAWAILYQNAAHNTDFLDTNVSRKIKKELSEYFQNKNIKLNSYSIDSLSELGMTVHNIETLLPYIDLKSFDTILENSLNLITILNSGKIIKNAAEKASRVIKALKNYVHEDHFEKRTIVDVRSQIEMCLVLYQNKIKLGMEIITEFLTNPFIVGYSDQLNQIWINLINNALYAVQFDGRLIIRTFFKDEYLCISFTDNGHGIADEIKSKIFKPFFTTKAAEDGSGLGLDICKKIAEAHKGKIEFTSVPGETCFIVYLNRYLEQE